MSNKIKLLKLLVQMLMLGVMKEDVPLMLSSTLKRSWKSILAWSSRHSSIMFKKVYVLI